MIGALLACVGSTGCGRGMFTERGIAARRVPKELLAKPRANKVDIDYALLRQEEPKEYRLDSKDILGIYVENILPPGNEPPPISIARAPEKESQNPPAVGYSVPVQEDGTISLPTLDPIKVTGMTVKEVEDTIRKAYLQKETIDAATKIIVTLQRKRTYQVLVIREDTGGQTTRSLRIGDQQVSTERGTGQVLDLIAYQNDVLHALVESGGLPGLEAVDEVVILRSKFEDAKKQMELMAMIRQQQEFDPCSLPPTFGEQVGITRIPMRLEPGEAPSLIKDVMIV
jgi:protein involved in polysaccharide export with SLBB domain